MVIEFVTRKILFGNNLIHWDLMIKGIDPTRFRDKELFFSYTCVSMELVKKKEKKEGNVYESKDKDGMQSICPSMGLERLVSGGCKDQRIWSCCHGVIWGEYDHHSLVLVKKIFSFEIFEVLWWLQWDQTLKLSDFMRVYLWHKISEMGPAEYCLHAEKLILAPLCD